MKTNWKILIPWTRVDIANESIIQRQTIQGEVGYPLALMISPSSHDYQSALRTLSQLNQESCSWKYFIKEGGNDWHEKEISQVGMVPPLSLPRGKRDLTCEEALHTLLEMANATPDESKRVQESLKLMGYFQLDGQLWYFANQRVKMALQLAVFAIRFQVIFCFLDRIKLLTPIEITQVFETIRTICGTFQVSILPVANKVSRDFPCTNFMNLIETMDLEVKVDDVA